MLPVSEVPGVAELLAEGWEVEPHPSLWDVWPVHLRMTLPDPRPERATSPFPEEREVRLVAPLSPRLAAIDVYLLLLGLVGETPFEDVDEDGPPPPGALRHEQERAALLAGPIEPLIDRWHAETRHGRLHEAWEAAGVPPAESWPWRSQEAEPSLRRGWRAAGVDDATALAWLSTTHGPASPAARAAYLEIVDHDAEALAWAAAEVAPDEIQAWRDAGAGPDAARALADPAALDRYREAGLDVDEATAAGGQGLGPGTARRWRDAGVAVPEVRAWTGAAGGAVVNFGWVARPGETAEDALRRLGFPPPLGPSPDPPPPPSAEG